MFWLSPPPSHIEDEALVELLAMAIEEVMREYAPRVADYRIYRTCLLLRPALEQACFRLKIDPTLAQGVIVDCPHPTADPGPTP